MTRWSRWLVLGVFCAGCAGSGAGLRDEVPPSDPPARVSLEKGLDAVSAKNWKDAVRYFSAAQRKAPFAPPVLFNLGLAHSRAGNEVLADIWLRAYLSAVPDAQNAPQIRAEVTRLEASLEGKMAKLLDEALAQGELLPIKTPDGYGAGPRAEAAFTVAQVAFALGDEKRGAAAYERFMNTRLGRGPGFEIDTPTQRKAERAAFLAAYGDGAGARALLEPGTDEYRRKSILAEVAAQAVAQGRLGEADDLLRELNIRDYQLERVVFAFIRKGDLVRAEAAAERLESPGGQWSVYVAMAERSLYEGNVPEAMRLAQKVPGQSIRAESISGSVASALRKGAELERNSFSPFDVEQMLCDITRYQILLGDMPSAERAAVLSRSRAPEEDSGGFYYATMADAYLALGRGDAEGALAKVDEALAIGRNGRRVGADETGTKTAAFEFALALKNPAAAERVADAFVRTGDRLDALYRLRGWCEKHSDPAASRLGTKIAEVEKEARLGAEAPPADVVALRSWEGLAAELEKYDEYADFPAYLQSLKEQEAKNVPRELSHTALRLGGALVRIRTAR